MKKTTLVFITILLSLSATSQNIWGQYESLLSTIDLYSNNSFKYVDKNNSDKNAQGQYFIKDSVLCLELSPGRCYQFIIQDSLHISALTKDCKQNISAGKINPFRKTKTYNLTGNIIANYQYKYTAKHGYLLHGKQTYFNQKGAIIKVEKYKNGKKKN